ncbi:TetR/AcrR family transcriptional regulator [Kribbella sp. NPDC051718]|uniref:TetR/AcrR family transcriptional regulator n=1 Tax=Kribbella sp. NPDC051718 TaxID=3155168 RepID=UPI003415C378
MSINVTEKRPPTRERILATADELFRMHGLRGVGIDRIIAESGVAKSTLYAHFPSKDELIEAYLVKADERWRGYLRQAAIAAGTDPKEQLVGLFDAVDDAYKRHQLYGCPFINAAAESEPGSRAHAATLQHKKAVREWVRFLAEAAGADDPVGLAMRITLLIDGALAAERLEQDSAMPAAAKAAARVLVDAACK